MYTYLYQSIWEEQTLCNCVPSRLWRKESQSLLVSRKEKSSTGNTVLNKVSEWMGDGRRKQFGTGETINYTL